MAYTKVEVDDFRKAFETEMTVDQIELFINMAHRKVDNVLGSEPDLSNDDLRDIELLYAAGLAETRDPRAVSMKGAATSVDYGDAPSYLELAFMHDPTGKLRAASNAKQGIEWTVGLFND